MSRLAEVSGKNKYSGKKEEREGAGEALVVEVIGEVMEEAVSTQAYIFSAVSCTYT